MIYSGVFAYAGLHSDLKNAQIEIMRNFKEDEKRAESASKQAEKNHEYTVKAVERIDTTIASMGSLNVKIGVLETKLESINETLKRMEKQLDRPHKTMMEGKHGPSRL
jgi:phage shock protein A